MNTVVLGTSTVFGGGGSEWFQSTSRKTARLLRLAHDVHPQSSSEAGAITIMFQVQGSVSGPEFEGIRAGRLSRAAKGLVVEVAVPERVDEPDSFVGRVLLEAVKYASDVFAKKKVPVDLTRAAQIAESVARDLGYEPPALNGDGSLGDSPAGEE